MRLSGKVSVSDCVSRTLTSVPSAETLNSDRLRKIRTFSQTRQNSAAVQPVMLLSSANVKVGVVPGIMLIRFASLNTDRDNIVDIHLPFRLCHTEKLPVALPQIEKKAERRQPHLLGGKMKLRRSVIEKPGEQFRIGNRSPTYAFFALISLSTFRFVPLYIASKIADLYSASSRGLVSSSTVSCVSSSCLSSGARRLWISTD